MKELFNLIIHFRLKTLFYSPTQNEIIRIFRYVFVGGIAFLFDYLFFFLAGLILGDTTWGIVGATAIGFVIGLTINYFASKKVVFTENPRGLNAKSEFIVYGIIGLFGLLITEGLMLVMILVMNKYIARLIVSIMVLLYNYFARKLILYRKSSIGLPGEKL
ncbi:MAG: GtrA family protein [Candidatus Izemoplasmatales bacterium]|nr:GtrA family protein [Candidatus Izemoplasmatales bacterium]MDD4595765.1 GtrA family protein [Candidatus Izemoplasmatales bacterium]